MMLHKQRDKGIRIAILFSLFVVMTGYGVLLPVLPFYVERLSLKSGIDQETINFHVGALTSVYSLFQLVFAVVWGTLSDRFGRRRFIAMGLIGFILMEILTGLSTSLTMFYVARILGGILTAALIPVSNAYLCDITSPNNRGKIMGWSGMAISTGIIVGPMAGAFLSKTDIHLSLKVGIFHIDKFSVPFFALIIPAMAALIMVIRILKPDINKTEPALLYTSAHVSESPKYSLFVLLLFSFIFQFSVTSFEAVFSIYAKSTLLFNTYQIGAGFMLCGLFMAIFQPLFASVKTRMFSDTVKLLAGFVIAAFALVVLPFVRGQIFVYILIVLFATGGAMIVPQLSALISLADGSHTAKNLSVQASVNNAGQILGPLLGTWLIGNLNFIPFLISGGVLIIPVLILKRWRNQQ